MRRAVLALALSAPFLCNSANAHASAPAKAENLAHAASDLQSPEQVSTRYSAYSLPARQWSIDVGALGVGDGDVFALLAVAYGLGSGVQLNVNLAHVGVGLLNVGARWHFIHTRYFDLGARLGFWYGHGEWFWFADPLAKRLLSKLDVVKVPLELVASSRPTSWLELDFGVQYSYSKFFGSSSTESSIFTDSELGMQQFFVRPGARLFITSRTAVEIFAKLPFYSSVPIEGREPTVPFKYTWGIEGGLRSRLAPGLFGNVRLNYSSVSNLLYGARLYPSFEIEIRP
jgi:hypothetical protein